MYPSVVRKNDNVCAFTPEERATMWAADNRRLLPSFHKNRTKLVTWAVSNLGPRNNRNQFYEALRQFVDVSYQLLKKDNRGFITNFHVATAAHQIMLRVDCTVRKVMLRVKLYR